MTETPSPSWPNATPEQRIYLEQLERVLSLPESNIKWEDVEVRQFYMMFRGMVSQSRVVKRDFLDDEKHALKKHLISKIYDQVRETPAEAYFRKILSSAK